jgi:hypothetical protein
VEEEDIPNEEENSAPFALSSSVVETSAGGAAEGLASIHEGLAAEGLGAVRLNGFYADTCDTHK